MSQKTERVMQKPNTKPRCPTMLAFNQNGKVVPIFCQSWYCPRCAQKLAAKWAMRAKLHIMKHGDAYFWTLTMRPKYKTATHGYQDLPRLWNTFRKIIQRLMSAEKWDYIAFVEGQPKRQGMPHFHVISMIKSPKRLKDIAMQAGFGFQAKEIKVTGARVANYVAKYATKSGASMPKKFRRVRVSETWEKLPEGDNEITYYVQSKKESLSDFVMRVSALTGVAHEDLVDRWLVAKSDLYNQSNITD